MLETIIEFAGKRFCAIVNNFVCSHVASLSKALSAKIARIGLFTGMPTLMSLKIAQLREPLATTGLPTFKRLITSVCSCVNIEMGLLKETLVAARNSALVSLLWFHW